MKIFIFALIMALMLAMTVSISANCEEYVSVIIQRFLFLAFWTTFALPEHVFIGFNVLGENFP